MSSNGTVGMEVVVKEPAYTDGNTPSPADMTAPASQLTTFIDRYKSDPESVYNTWYAGSETRMKAFRAIRRGVKDVVSSIAAGTFGNDFKGSPLEVVLTAITEQKQVFEGAAHPFYWKPKLRIPDIYENETNKKAFGLFLNVCLNATKEEQVALWSRPCRRLCLSKPSFGPPVWRLPRR